jgi:hypothetical protein
MSGGRWYLHAERWVVLAEIYLKSAVDPSDSFERKHVRAHPVCAHSTHTNNATIYTSCWLYWLHAPICWSAQLVQVCQKRRLMTSRSHGVQRLQQRSQHRFAKRMKCCGNIEYDLLSENHS